jgi:cobalt-zinc-cadmium efflux system outer membrane protein
LHGLGLLALACALFWLQPVAAQVAAPLDALTLAEAENLAVARNREVLAARRAVEAAQADILTAGARPNPQLSLSTTNINPQSGIGAGNLRSKYVDTIMRLDQLVERGNKRELRVDTAEKMAQAATLLLDDTLRTQRLAVAGAYYDLKLAQDKVAIADETAGLFTKSLEATELRQKAGDVAAADVSRIRVDTLRAQNDARAARAELARAQIALAFLLGAEQEARTLRAAEDWPALQERLRTEITEDLIDRRPDVRAAQARLDAALSARELARALRTRDVSVGVQYEHYPIDPTGAMGTGLGSGISYGVAVSVPLFVRYYYEGEIARAEADLAAAQDVVERMRAQVRTDLQQAATDLQSALERRARFESTLLPEAQKAAAYAEFAYRNGAIGVLDLLDARRTLRALQFEAATARAEHARANAAWRAAALTPTP